MFCVDEHVLQAGPVAAPGSESRGHGNRTEAPPTRYIPHPPPSGAAQVHLLRVFRDPHELPVELHTASEKRTSHSITIAGADVCVCALGTYKHLGSMIT